MFKKTLSFLSVLALLVSCNKSEPLVPVNVKVHDFHIAIDTFSDTKATSPSAFNDITALTLAFYNGDTEVYKTTQAKGSEGYGSFSLALPMGSYTLVALGYYSLESSPITLTSPTEASYTGSHAMETFAYTQAVNITNTSDVNLSITLDRICSQLQVISTDGKTANASKVKVTLSGGSRSFNPTTGLALDDDGFDNTVNISASVGTPSTSKTFLFLSDDEETLDVTIDVLDADGESISHKVVEDVPFQRNRVTKLTGSVYSADAGATFQLNGAWLSDNTVNF